MSKLDAVVITVAGAEVRFGKGEKVVALPLVGARGWRYVSRDGDSFEAPASDFPQEISQALELHGQKQKEKDTVANADTPAEMMAGIRRMHEQLASGTFNAQGGGGFGVEVALAEALAEVTKQSVDDAKAFLKGLTAPERDGLKADPEVAPAYQAKLKARAAPATAGLAEKLKAFKAKLAESE